MGRADRAIDTDRRGDRPGGEPREDIAPKIPIPREPERTDAFAIDDKEEWTFLTKSDKYDAQAVDQDGDGMLQDGTKFERPANKRGQEKEEPKKKRRKLPASWRADGKIRGKMGRPDRTVDTDKRGDKPGGEPRDESKPSPQPEPQQQAGAKDELGRIQGGQTQSQKTRIDNEQREQDAGSLVDRIKKDGGFTYQPANGTSPKSGFAVAVFPESEVSFPASDLDLHDLVEYMQDNLKAFEGDDKVHFGGWFNKKSESNPNGDDKIYLDMSMVFDSQEEAIEMAKSKGQLGIFDLAKGETIETMTPEERAEWEKSNAPKSRIADETPQLASPEDVAMNTDVEADEDNDGVTDWARLGVKGNAGPPKKVPRVPNLTDLERAVESTFADWYEEDPHRAAAEYRKRIESGKLGDGPNVYNTDDCKTLSADWTASIENRGLYNNSTFQTANAICKLAFLTKLDEIAKLPEDQRTAFVTAGGVACHGIDTPVVMFDGTLKMIQDVQVGDVLMGPDSKPRNVLQTHSGKGKIYRVIPKKGESFTVNEEHVLVVKYLKRKKVNGKETYEGFVDEEITVKDFISRSKRFRRQALLFRTGVEFAEKPVTLDPYFLGYWLGNGLHTIPSITTMDEEVVEYIKEFAGSHGAYVHCRSKDSLSESSENKAKDYKISATFANSVTPNPVTKLMRDYNLIRNKHIPKDYLANCRRVRLALLAGLLDSDGHYDTKRSSFEYVSKLSHLAESIVFLARSLGFHASIAPKEVVSPFDGTVGVYYRVYIGGDGLDEIPTLVARKRARCKKQFQSNGRATRDSLRSGFTIEETSQEDFYGVTLDSDHLYLLGDFTVTHNSGKGHAISTNPEIKEIADKSGAVWDAAGEQYSTELPWLHEEFEKRGIKPTYMFVHANPKMTFWNEGGWGAVDRAKKKGRMVDCVAHAESYYYGAKNFEAFRANVGDKANFIVVDNYNGKPKTVDKVPMEQIPSPAEVLKSNQEALAKSDAPDWVKRCGFMGERIWPDVPETIRKSMRPGQYRPDGTPVPDRNKNNLIYDGTKWEMPAATTSTGAPSGKKADINSFFRTPQLDAPEMVSIVERLASGVKSGAEMAKAGDSAQDRLARVHYPAQKLVRAGLIEVAGQRKTERSRDAKLFSSYASQNDPSGIEYKLTERGRELANSWGLVDPDAQQDDGPIAHFTKEIAEIRELLATAKGNKKVNLEDELRRAEKELNYWLSQDGARKSMRSLAKSMHTQPWDERKHPRDKYGRFIRKADIEYAATSGDHWYMEQLISDVQPGDLEALEQALKESGASAKSIQAAEDAVGRGTETPLVVDDVVETEEPTFEAKTYEFANKSASDYGAYNLGAADSQQRYTDSGKYSPERQALHEKIVDELLGSASPVPDNQQPYAIVMGGGPAVGKGTIIRSGMIDLPDSIAMIDSDEVKGKLPDYREMIVEGNERDAAWFVHEESSELAKRAVSEGLGSRLNVGLDGTGNGAFGSLKRKVDGFRSHGHRVRAIYATCDTELAIKRANARAEQTGRYVPEAVIRSTHDKVSRVFPRAIEEGMFDEWELWSTDSEPVKIASGLGKLGVVADQKLWEDFLKKGGDYTHKRYKNLFGEVQKSAPGWQRLRANSSGGLKKMSTKEPYEEQPELSAEDVNAVYIAALQGAPDPIKNAESKKLYAEIKKEIAAKPNVRFEIPGEIPDSE